MHRYHYRKGMTLAFKSFKFSEKEVQVRRKGQVDVAHTEKGHGCIPIGQGSVV